MRHIGLKLSLLILSMCFVSVSADALPCKWEGKKKSAPVKADLERCRKAQGSAELSLNNVRTRINQGGNMWFDGSTARYYVPKDGSATALYAAALWIGGEDDNKQLRVAAVRFAAEGDDFWPGPLTVDGNASINKAICDKWDKFYKIKKATVQQYVNSFQKDSRGIPIPGTGMQPIPEEILNWPAHGTDPNTSRYLAPFYDWGNDGEYNPEEGDYPYYDFSGELCPTTIKANLPAGSTYEPKPTMETKLGTGGSVPAIHGLLVDQVLKGDETLWWIFNDKGASHTESKSENPIGLEIHAQAFAFTMNNEINNMTFYSYEIINRSTYTLNNTYFSQWVDPDLGYAYDDYVGCDVERGLGYCYNGTATDGPATMAYIGNPPAVGIDFFQGPYMDPTPNGVDRPKVHKDALIKYYGGGLESYLERFYDSTGHWNDEYSNIILADNADLYKKAWFPVDYTRDTFAACSINGVNFGNGIADDERFGMRRFVYYNNSANDPNGEPSKASDYYNYLRGFWKDNKRMLYGGDGYNTGTEAGIYSDFMFPGNSDMWGWGVYSAGEAGVDGDYTGAKNPWSEKTAGNSPNDRRFMQSAGPFTLKPGAVNYITVGIPFAQAASGGPEASVELLRLIDDKCQALFDNCFNVLEGPDAPDVVVQELDREIILYLTNTVGNNVREQFHQADITIPKYSIDTTGGKSDTTWYDNEYEGYQIFQLVDESVSVADIHDNSKARLVAQCDIENYSDAEKTNPIGELVNVTITNGNPSSQVMVSGSNTGIKHSFRITEDQFATTTDRRVVNNKKYYYIAVAYAYNNFKQYNVEDPTKLDGQKEPYLASRKKGDGSGIEPVVAIPHKLEPEQNGTLVQSSYGVSPEIMRIEGNGNGGMVLNLTQESIDKLMTNTEGSDPINFLDTVRYQQNYGPVNIAIVDPLKVKAGEYEIRLLPTSDTLDYCGWVLYRKDGQPLFGEKNSSVDSIVYTYSINSDTSIAMANEQIIFELGLAITFTNVPAIAHAIDLTKSETQYINNKLNDGVLLSSGIEHKDPNQAWLSGFMDNDASPALDWIKSGPSTDSDDGDYGFTLETATASSNPEPIDGSSQFENCVSGTWTAYRLASIYSTHPAFTRRYFMTNEEAYANTSGVTKYTDTKQIASLVYNDLNNLASVDIVFTSDKSKWTRCPIIEMGTDYTLTEEGAMKFMLRRHNSVDKEGADTSYSWESNGSTVTADKGMGWFPGYAINIETGERLNIIFGENSSYGQYNGRDMMWNPTLSGNGSTYGGMHFVYVLGTSKFVMKNDGREYQVTPPRYDEGKWAYEHLKALDNLSGDIFGNDDNSQILDTAEQVFASVMWAGMPAPWYDLFAQGIHAPLDTKSPSLIPTDATVKIRMRKPYAIGWSSSASGAMAATPQNANYPMYRFIIGEDLETRTGLVDAKGVAESALDYITVVPNPYFAYDEYEKDQIQNLVKITNLPPECYITIYSVDGTVIRKFRGPSKSLVSGGKTALTSIDWDLKNERGLQISGGVYLIHIKADGIGEKLIKWFGALRPVDLNSFQ